MLKQIILSFILFILLTHSAQAMQPCDTNRLTKKQALERFDNIIVIKVKSSKDETDWFLENMKEKNKDNPEEQKIFDETFMAYVTYEATVLENFKGSLKGEITLAEYRDVFNFDGALGTGFYYILGLDNKSEEDINFIPENVILIPGCATISIGINKFNGDFLDKVEEFRK